MKEQNWPQLDGHRRRITIVRSPSRRLVTRFLVVVTVLGLFQFFVLHLRYRDALAAKYVPTDFAESNALLTSKTAHLSSLTQEAGLIQGREMLLSNRQDWKRLGGGQEGEAFLYNNSVIKIYNEANTPFRNCAPVEGTGLRWPTEIPATLLLGDSDGFIPLEDFFRAPTTVGGDLQWHMVTPFIRAGTLNKLGAATAEEGLPYQEVDKKYRPSFESLLAALDHLHVERDLCHDDVKLDNIFVESTEDPTRWVLGDLGNARQPDHPYHFSALWTADTPQLADCRLNDVVRLTKSFLSFVRAASANQAAFDRAFFAGTQPLSQLYWSVVNMPAPAAEVRLRSMQSDPAAAVAEVPDQGAGPIGMPLSLAVSRHLRVRASERLGRFFGLARILGIPVSACSGV